MNIAKHLCGPAYLALFAATASGGMFRRELDESRAKLRADVIEQTRRPAAQAAEARADRPESPLHGADIALRYFRISPDGRLYAGESVDLMLARRMELGVADRQRFLTEVSLCSRT